MSKPKILFALAAVVVLGGCQSEEPQAEPTAQPAAEPTAEVADPESQQAAPTTRQQVIDRMAKYVAPYPDRREWFVPPKDVPQTNATEGAGNVQLRGLVNVGEPQAILDIEGAVAVVAVGTEKYGVRVVDISGPKVTLQRGGTKWTASIE